MPARSAKGADESGQPAHRNRPTGPVWTRPPQPPEERLTLDAILTVAIRLADTEGLDAVSIRRIAGDLNTRPMSLYSFFSRKDDLVDLMLDRVLDEAKVPDLPSNWQDALRAIAHANRMLSMNHPWVPMLLSQRPALGPNRIRNLEQSLAAIADLKINPDLARSLLLAVDAFTIGMTAMALGARQMQQRDGLSDAEWHAAATAYFDRLLQTGDYPHLQQLDNTSMWRSDLGDLFDDGLSWLLAGFAATLPKQVPPGSNPA